MPTRVIKCILLMLIAINNTTIDMTIREIIRIFLSGIFKTAMLKHPIPPKTFPINANISNSLKERFMTEDANRVLAKIYWSVNTTNGKSGVELLFAGSGDNAANATIGFFSGRGFHALNGLLRRCHTCFGRSCDGQRGRRSLPFLPFRQRLCIDAHASR